MYRHLPALELATCCAAAASCAPTRQPCLQTAVLHWHVQIFANFIVRLTVSMLNCIQGVRTPREDVDCNSYSSMYLGQLHRKMCLMLSMLSAHAGKYLQHL